MPREYPRSRRIEEQIQRILSDVIRVRIRDPRLRHTIITAVDVSRDLGVAWVHFTGLDASQPREDMEKALESAGGFFRRELAQELTVRNVPQLRFRYDDSGSRADEMDNLIASVVDKDLKAPGYDERHGESAGDDDELD
jgi:ribosome-binding factor A